MAKRATGVWPVMLTPFTTTGAIDWSALERLTEWYIDAGVEGLFAVSLSSEMFELSPQERVQLAQTVVEVADDRVPVAATGSFGSTREDILHSIESIAATGVDVVVLNVAELAPVDADETVWKDEFDAIIQATTTPVGLYECPRPYHRLLSTALVDHAGSTSRVVFLKDTCCDRGRLTARANVASDTPLGICNANVATLLDSLRAGAPGYSGTLANVCPSLLAWLCKHPTAPQSDTLHRDLTMMDHTIRPAYPAFAKAYHARWGIGGSERCRTKHDPLRDRHLVTLDRLHDSIDAWHNRLDIEPPSVE